MNVGTTKYVTDKRVVNVSYAKGTAGQENWYLFRVPIKDYTKNVGNITDFKSIRFARMYKPLPMSHKAKHLARYW